MKKTVLSMLIGVGCLTFAGPAAAQSVIVADPTGGEFSGAYQCGYEWKWNEQTQQWEEDTTKPAYCSQTGYVYVGTDGIAACNGNEEITRPDDGSPLQGYIWIGPGLAATNPTAEAPGGAFGAGNNHEDADGNPTGDGACREAHSEPPPKPTEPPA